jgi:hypothetical protein
LVLGSMCSVQRDAGTAGLSLLSRIINSLSLAPSTLCRLRYGVFFLSAIASLRQYQPR